MGCEPLFHDLCFLFVFAPAVIIGYWLVPRRRWKLSLLVGASFLFYSFWDVRFVALLAASVLVDFYIGLRIGASDRKKRWLWASIAFNLGVLAFFKYAVFVGDTARSVLAIIGSPVQLPYYSIVLPVGISFYTFQSMSYTIDVYRGTVRPTRDLLKYSVFVSLFPQLVAGPIVRYREMSDQLDDMPRRITGAELYAGLMLFTIGLSKKVLVADTIAGQIDPIWAGEAALSTASAWVASVGFALQLYFDFSGYSDMAIGLGAPLGFRFPINFRAPYQALNPSDFWRRWHMTLSSFLRDYLYVPLGGNRKGPRRTTINVGVVMVLGGLWHGAAWTFVAWGMYHGLLLVAYRSTAPRWDAMPRALQRLAMLILVVIGWVMFRASSVSIAGDFYGAMFSPGAVGAWLAYLPAVAAFLVLLALTWVLRPTAEWSLEPRPTRLALAATLVSLSIVLLRGGESPFLYYQF